jgi:hypothetical protein
MAQQQSSSSTLAATGNLNPTGGGGGGGAGSSGGGGSGYCHIEEGNERSWFTMKDKQGKRVVIDVLQLQLLRDVKTRWDSVYDTGLTVEPS